MRSTVLFVSHDASRTGGPLFLLRYLQWLRKESLFPFRILLGKTGPLFSEFESLAPVSLFEPNPTIYYRILRRLGRNQSYRFAHLERLRAQLSDSRIGLIYANTIVNGKILDWLTFLNCPALCHVHELEQPIRDYGPANLLSVRRKTSSYIAVSAAVKKNLVENHGIQEAAVQVIHGFIPTDAPTGVLAACDVREELGLPQNARIVCACGSIESRKGFDLFLEVAENVCRGHKGVPIHFVWIGGRADLVKSINKQIKLSKLNNCVHFIGARSDVAPYYRAADLLLVTSREDPFPLVMMEAALHGMPIICFGGSGGAPEFVQSDAGFVVDGFNTGEMAGKVTELLRDDELRRRMGSTARERVLLRHSLSTGALRISSVVRQALLAAPQFSADPVVR